MRQNHAANIMALDPDDLERFVATWLDRKKELYHDHEHFGGTGDMGRDVVGYGTPRRLEGPWDCYQCKQIKSQLTERAAAKELGKIFYWVSKGKFTLPENYIFVAPKSFNQEIRELIAHPSRFKATILAKWDEWCGKGITERTKVPLDAALREVITNFDFSKVHLYHARKLALDPQIRPVLVEWFGEDPGNAPRGEVPPDIQPEELNFAEQLREIYGVRGGPFSDIAAVMADPRWGEHLRRQRRRFFDAAAFRRYYRDNTPKAYLVDFNHDVYDGVIGAYERTHLDRLDRHEAVMDQAALIRIAGVLGTKAVSAVVQGTCHHFVNEDRLSWKR